VIRDLAENGAQVAVKDNDTGRIRQKWLSIRGRSADAKDKDKDKDKAIQAKTSKRSRTPALQSDPALRERGRDGVQRRSRKVSTSLMQDRESKKGKASSKTVYASKVGVARVRVLCSQPS